MTHFQSIDDKAVQTAKRFLREEGLLLECLMEVDANRVFENFGYTSLFTYCTLRLKLSESMTYAFISVARKSQEVPKLKEAVTEGKLSVSQAKRIVSVIEPGNANHWIEEAATKKQREIEKLVAQELPLPQPSAKLKAIGPDMSQIKLVIPDSLRTQIERLQEIRGCSLLEALTYAVETTLKKTDPVLRAKRQQNKAEGKRKHSPNRPQPSSRKVPQPVAHQVNLRDQGQCTAKHPNGERCDNKRWLHFHHLTPYAQGGKHTAENLTTLCSAHHRLHHKPAPKKAHP